jgi:hypothetical protein
MKTTKFRVCFSNTRYGYMDIEVSKSNPSLIVTIADNIRRVGEFPKCLDNYKDNGWILENFLEVEEQMNKVDSMLKKYSSKFNKIFGVELKYFVNPMFKMFDIYDFDIIGFDDWLHRKKGYSEDKHGSMKDFITLKYGETARIFLEEVMGFKGDEK